MFKYLTKKLFSRRTPGPFGCLPGSHGVDATFNITCLESGQIVAAAHYWDRHDEAKLVAEVITVALNDHLGFSEASPELTLDDLCEFSRRYPGSYEIQADFCRGYGPLHSVDCRLSGETVISCIDYGHLPTWLTAHAICNALNEWLAKDGNRANTSNECVEVV